MSDLEMNSGERGNPFSSSDEAFFQAGVHSEREPTSERPVTLDAEEQAPEASSLLSLREARRARLLRAVKSTVAGLSLLAVVGLARYALRPGIAEVRQATPGLVRAGSPSEPAENPVNDEKPPGELVASLGDANGGAALWFKPSRSEAPSAPVLFGPEPASWCSDPPPSSEPQGEIARESKTTTTTLASKHAKAKSSIQTPARPGAKPAHRRGKVAPVSKSALLKAIRAT
ncbi:MAG TPA: hypothetical protein VNN72_02265 [Polyangiaceae bacterium]|nr:hypothetical protein [Polyangiaceae bacterium]